MCIYYVIWFCYIFFKRPRLGCSFCWSDAVKKDRGNHTKTFLEKIGNKETQIKQRSDLSFALKSAFKHWAQRKISTALMVKLHRGVAFCWLRITLTTSKLGGTQNSFSVDDFIRNYFQNLWSSFFLFHRAETTQRFLGLQAAVPHIPKRPYLYGNLAMDKENDVVNVKRKFTPFDPENRGRLFKDATGDYFGFDRQVPELGFRHPNIPFGNVRTTRLLSDYRWRLQGHNTNVKVVTQELDPARSLQL